MELPDKIIDLIADNDIALFKEKLLHIKENNLKKYRHWSEDDDDFVIEAIIVADNLEFFIVFKKFLNSNDYLLEYDYLLELKKSAQYGSMRILKYIIEEKKYNANSYDSIPALLAAKFNQIDALKFLLKPRRIRSNYNDSIFIWLLLKILYVKTDTTNPFFLRLFRSHIIDLSRHNNLSIIRANEENNNEMVDLLFEQKSVYSSLEKDDKILFDKLNGIKLMTQKLSVFN